VKHGLSKPIKGGLYVRFFHFIANDMIHEGQQERFDSTGELYKQYWDEVYKKRNKDAFDE